MQTISIPFSCSSKDAEFLKEIRRVQSAAIRTAYANAQHSDGARRSEKEVREIVKSRFTRCELLDSWAMHCATRAGLLQRKVRPDGKMVFGGRKDLARRHESLITAQEWKHRRLSPFVSFGDRQKVFGNQNIQLIDDTTIIEPV